MFYQRLDFNLNKHFRESIDWKVIFAWHNILYLLFGVGFAIFALKGFMVPNHFLDGGVTGISILLHEVTHINLNILLIVINLPFIYIGYKKIGKTFAVQACIAIFLLAIGLMIPITPVTSDKLLIALFGGFFIGLGMGLIIRGGGVIDGAEIIAVYTTKKIGLTISELIMIMNSFIFLSAAYKFGVETAMYSIITYFTAMKTVDYVVDGIEEYTALNIIASQSEEIKTMIVNELRKGISVYKGERGYLPGAFDIKNDCDIILTIVTRLEVLRIKEAVLLIDPAAFMFVQSIKEVKGGVIKHKSGH